MDDNRQIEPRPLTREERRQARYERRQARWRGDPLGPIFGALVLIWLGVVLLAAQNSELIALGPFRVTWGNVWMYFLAGLGALLILQGLLRIVIPGYRSVASPLIWGTILLLIGLAGLLPGVNWTTIWPIALIVLGVGLLLSNLFRR